MTQLRHYRKTHLLTQAKLAAKMHMSQSDICEIERGFTKPWPHEAHAMADFFGVKVEALFPDGLRERILNNPKCAEADVYIPPDTDAPTGLTRHFPLEFDALCKKCGRRIHFRTDEYHAPTDAELECPSCAMPIRDIVPLREMTI